MKLDSQPQSAMRCATELCDPAATFLLETIVTLLISNCRRLYKTLFLSAPIAIMQPVPIRCYPLAPLKYALIVGPTIAASELSESVSNLSLPLSDNDIVGQTINYRLNGGNKKVVYILYQYSPASYIVE